MPRSPARTRLRRYSLVLVLLTACDGETESPKPTRAQLLDPQFCRDCHPKHYEEWSASMHAYASRDPVFLAMNKRGQEEDDIGGFCVQCHAPMALREGAITDFADLSDVPDHLQGVTCYFCHNAVKVHEPYNNANIELANDTIMRGAIRGRPPIDSPAHGVLSEKSSLHDRRSVESSKLCGACHDIVNPQGLALESTFLEYRESVVANSPESFSSCQGCHMRPKHEQETAATSVEGVGARTVHWHLFPAVDVALTPDMPHQDVLRAAVEDCELQLLTLSDPQVEIGEGWQPGEPFLFRIAVEHLAAHNFPSGATADRRLWFEVTAYDENDRIVLESGKIADGELEEKPEDDPRHDWQFRPFRDYLVDADGHETHMFWEAAQFAKRELIPFAKDNIPGSHTAYRSFVTDVGMERPATRIELKLRLRPMGVDVMQDLVQSGHLDPAIIEAMPTYTVAHQIAVLQPDGRKYKLTDPPGFEPGCEKFVALYNAATRDLESGAARSSALVGR